MYDQVLAILASPSWIALYKNVQAQTLKTDAEINTNLSSKLYTSLRTSMADNTEKLMMSKIDVRGKGLAYLAILKQSYKATLHRAGLLHKEKEYSLLFQASNKTIDDFAAMCISIRNTLRDQQIHTTNSGLCDRFLKGPDPIFMKIQQTSYEGLPIRWQVTDIQTLINLATSYREEKLAVRECNRMFKEANKHFLPSKMKPIRKLPRIGTGDALRPTAASKVMIPCGPRRAVNGKQG